MNDWPRGFASNFELLLNLEGALESPGHVTPMVWHAWYVAKNGGKDGRPTHDAWSPKVGSIGHGEGLFDDHQNRRLPQVIKDSPYALIHPLHIHQTSPPFATDYSRFCLLKMHQQILAAFLASAGIAAAAPTAFKTKSFKLDQVPSGKTYLSGPIQLNKTYSKYAHMGAEAPEDVKAAAAAAAQKGSVSANPQVVRGTMFAPCDQQRQY